MAETFNLKNPKTIHFKVKDYSYNYDVNIKVSKFYYNKSYIDIPLEFNHTTQFSKIGIDWYSPTELMGIGSNNGYQPKEMGSITPIGGDLFLTYKTNDTTSYKYYGSLFLLSDVYLRVHESQFANLKNKGICFKAYDEIYKMQTDNLYLDVNSYFAHTFNFSGINNSIDKYTAYLYDGAFKKIKEAHLANSSGTLTKLK